MTLHSGVTHPSKEYGAIDLKVEGDPYLNLLQCRSIDKLATDVSAMKIDRSLDRDEIIHFIQTHRGFRTIDNPIVGILADPILFVFIYDATCNMGRKINIWLKWRERTG